MLQIKERDVNVKIPWFEGLSTFDGNGVGIHP